MYFCSASQLEGSSKNTLAGSREIDTDATVSNGRIEDLASWIKYCASYRERSMRVSSANQSCRPVLLMHSVLLPREESTPEMLLHCVWGHPREPRRYKYLILMFGMGKRRWMQAYLGPKVLNDMRSHYRRRTHHGGISKGHVVRLEFRVMHDHCVQHPLHYSSVELRWKGPHRSYFDSSSANDLVGSSCSA